MAAKGTTSTLPNRKQSQGEHQSIAMDTDADTNIDVNGVLASVAPASDVAVRAEKAAADQLPQSASQSTQANANRRPTRQSRRLQRKAERDAQLSAQGLGYAGFPPASFQTNLSFFNQIYSSNNNYNINAAQSQYSTGNISMPQNLNSNAPNMVNFGFGPNYAVSNQSAFNQLPPALQQPHLLQMQFAQQMMIAQQMFGVVGNGLPFNNAGGIQQQQPIRTMSTMVNTVTQTRIRATQNFGTDGAASDTAMQAESLDNKNRNSNNNKPGERLKWNTVQPPTAPVPQPSYLVQAHKEPKDLFFMQPLLIILDLNGTLLYRKRRKFPPQFVRRPALNFFLERLTTRHVVMVWSSSRPETVNAICDSLFSENQKTKLIARWGRDKLGLDQSQYYAKVQVYKELEKVWADPVIQSKYPKNRKQPAGRALHNVLKKAPETAIEMEMTGAQYRRWDQSNTVLIDDSTIKAAANPYNILEVPEFTNEPNDDDSTVLRAVLDKIRILAKSNDVSQRLRSWGEDGIKISRDEVLRDSSASEKSSSDSEPEEESKSVKEDNDNNKKKNMNKEKHEPSANDNLVYNTDNEIVPQELGPKGTTASLHKEKTRINRRGHKQKKLKRTADGSEKSPEAAPNTDGDLVLPDVGASGVDADASNPGAGAGAGAGAAVSDGPRTTTSRGGKKNKAKKLKGKHAALTYIMKA